MPYTRLRFEPAAEDRIIEVGRVIKANNTHGAFYDQLDPRAGLGCHDYHVTLVASLHMYSDAEVAAALESVAPGACGMEFTVTIRRWEMSGRGSLKLVVDVENIEELQRRIHGLLPRGKPFRAPYHITMGTFQGSAQQRRAFYDSLQATPLLGLRFRGIAMEYENDADRPNPRATSLVTPLPPTDASMGTMVDAEAGVIRMRGMPFQTTVGEIQAFFTGRQIAPGGIHLEQGADGRPSGNALVKFVNEAEVQEAMKLNKHTIGDGTRYVDIFASTITEWATQRLTSAMLACNLLQPVLVRASREANPKRFAKMAPVDHDSLRAQLQPIHDDVKAAFEAAPAVTARWLQEHCNPYPNQDLANVVPGSGRWEYKLRSLHASAFGDFSFDAVCDKQDLMRPQAVPTGSARGWLPTKSPLMCYLSSSGLWITVRLQDLPGLVPGDRDHWHFSIAKISSCEVQHPKKKKPVKPTHTPTASDPSSSGGMWILLLLLLVAGMYLYSK